MGELSSVMTSLRMIIRDIIAKDDVIALMYVTAHMAMEG
jgi:hypothetical protein